MSSIWDWFRPLGVLIRWLDGRPRTTSQRRNACLQLETLENREVPSADVVLQPLSLSQADPQTLQVANNSVQPLNLSQTDLQTMQTANNPFQPLNFSQTFQQMLQAANNSVAGQAPALVQILTTVASSLPTISSGLNIAASDLSRYLGPQSAQQYTQALLGGVDSFLIGLETVTEFALQTAGVSQDPTFNMDVAVINVFMANPLNYTPPV